MSSVSRVQDSRWTGKVVWVTGASKGIGRALVSLLLDLGATVIGSARNKAALDDIDHPQFWGHLADVTQRDQLDAVVADIERRFGRLDAVICNAGVCKYIELPDFDTETIERIMSVNYGGCVNTIACALPLLKHTPNSHLVAVSSSNAYLGLPRAQAYGPSKAAIYNLMQSLKADLKGVGVNVSVVCPGFVETPLTEQNDFAMPFKISSEKAARCIVKGIEKNHFDIHFPKRFTLPLRWLRWLPEAWLYSLTAKISRNS